MGIHMGLEIKFIRGTAIVVEYNYLKSFREGKLIEILIREIHVNEN